ncbi:LOW QUALITY PROTEIN: outer dense fiber protein 4 [Balaenoptera ricei]|uniref:LOW QUALITY PROTEIN: outer dense fiber protein 4 n=1 Tax=Balaenoptera ricei TaxID=2746895 RepID=UPI0028BE7203|nr:LOW QUALITY PROTEIN: outer dense fiber protein 4 [Balaenoptera ricei]
MGTGDIRDEFPGSGGESDEHQKPGKGWEGWEAGGGGGELGQDEGVPNCVSTPDSNRQVTMGHHVEHRWVCPMPLQWRITHSSRWMSQVLASELSLIAFILLLVMVFSKKWLYLSRIRFYQHWPMNVSTKIDTSVHTMSLGLLQICKSKSCSNSENGKVFFTLFTLILFPINVWIFELKKNLSIPIGWSYFIGWLVFILYVTCAALCYFNHTRSWCLILSHPSGTVSSSSSVHQSVNEQVASNTAVDQEEVLDPE